MYYQGLICLQEWHEICVLSFLSEDRGRNFLPRCSVWDIESRAKRNSRTGTRRAGVTFPMADGASRVVFIANNKGPSNYFERLQVTDGR